MVVLLAEAYLIDALTLRIHHYYFCGVYLRCFVYSISYL